MSFSAKQFSDVFDMAEFVYVHFDHPEIRKNAQEMMHAVEDVVGQLRNGEDRERLGLDLRKAGGGK